MLPQFLLPETVARQDGASAELSLDKIGFERIGLDKTVRALLLTLGITRIMEQENLEVSIWGSADRLEWREVARFPQKFYCGTYSLVLDLTRRPEIRHLRAHWKMGRWGGKSPLFGFYLQVEEVKLKHAGAA